jgi:hypothetical protein
MADMADRLDRPCPYAAQAERLQSIGAEAIERLEDWVAGA